MSRRLTRKKARQLLEMSDISLLDVPTQKKKAKAPSKKERFEFLENQLAGERLTLASVWLRRSPYHSRHSHRTGRTGIHPTCPERLPLNNTTVRRALINKFTETSCSTSLLGDPMIKNCDILNDEDTKQHVADMDRAAAARLPRSTSKPVYDIYLNKPVAYEMPRHFLGPPSQCRIRSLKSQDELMLSEFLQGYVTLIWHNGMHSASAEPMIKWLGKLGEALIDYRWEDIRDCINAVLHEVGQGRMTWHDEALIA